MGLSGLKSRVNLTAGVLGLVAAATLLSAGGQARAQSETDLYSFGETGNMDGGAPEGPLLLDRQGNLYGTALGGGFGPGARGTVFKLTPSGYETTLHSFLSGQEGYMPYGGVVMDAKGNLYGTTYKGGTLTGTTACGVIGGCGTVFKLAPDGTETVLHTFGALVNGVGTDGQYPEAGVVLDSHGNLFGTTSGGGSSVGSAACGSAGCGTIYKITPDGTETVIHNFSGLDGNNPSGAKLIIDGQGNLYGTTAYGGKAPCSCGTVYKVTPQGGEELLHSFDVRTPDAIYPAGGVARDAEGNLYGATYAGGTGEGAAGAIYKVTPKHVESILYTFYNEYSGFGPDSDLAVDKQGNLYGATSAVEHFGSGGTVFKLDTSGNLTYLAGFALFDAGIGYVSGVIFDPAGNLYGTTASGGALGEGLVYKINLGPTPPTPKPVIYPEPGTYPEAQIITIDTQGGQVYYTTKYGDTPTIHSTPYTVPFLMSSTGSVAAIAVNPGSPPSSVVTAYYAYRVVEPIFNHGGGRYSGPISLTVSDYTPGAVIHYTTDGSAPTAMSATYAGPITVSKTETVRAIGLLPGYENSTVAGTIITIY